LKTISSRLIEPFFGNVRTLTFVALPALLSAGLVIVPTRTLNYSNYLSGQSAFLFGSVKSRRDRLHHVVPNVTGLICVLSFGQEQTLFDFLVCADFDLAVYTSRDLFFPYCFELKWILNTKKILTLKNKKKQLSQSFRFPKKIAKCRLLFIFHSVAAS
jgi:hypothetical protein